MELPIEIFRAGTHTDSNGVEHVFSADDIRELVEGYDPENAPAPLVLGHPKDNDPAYGWASRFSLRDNGTVSLDDASQVEPQFSELLKAGRYKKVSVSIFPRNAPSNPTPGKLYVRHIGFLGATAPAVSGLKPINHAGADEAIEIEFSAESEDSGMLSRIVRALVPHLRKELTPTDDQQDPTDMATEQEFAELQEQLKAQKDEVARLKKEAADLAESARRTAAQDFAESLSDSNHILPRHTEAVEEIAFALGSASFEFSAGDEKTTALAAFKTLIKELTSDENGNGRAVDFSEKSRKAKGGESLDFSDRKEGGAAEKAIEQYAAKHNCSFREAAVAVEQLAGSA